MYNCGLTREFKMKNIREIDPMATEPEDCDECGCEAGEFGPEDYVDGRWVCPECGHTE